MGTSKPRIQCYLEDKVKDLYAQFKKDRGITGDSEAINNILTEYFAVSPDNGLRATNIYEQQKSLLEERLEVYLAPMVRRLDYLEMMLSKLTSNLPNESLYNLLSELPIVEGELSSELSSELPTIEGELSSELSSELPTIEGELSSELSSELPTIEGELSSELSSELPTIEGELSSELSSELPTIEGELSSELPSELPTIEGELSSELPSELPTIEGELSSELSSELSTIEGELSSELSSELPTIEGELSSELPSELPTIEGELSSELINKKDMAKHLGISSSTVARRIKSGKFESFPSGYLWNAERDYFELIKP